MYQIKQQIFCGQFAKHQIEQQICWATLCLMVGV
jgi:hypothetical protein